MLIVVIIITIQLRLRFLSCADFWCTQRLISSSDFRESTGKGIRRQAIGSCSIVSNSFLRRICPCLQRSNRRDHLQKEPTAPSSSGLNLCCSDRVDPPTSETGARGETLPESAGEVAFRAKNLQGSAHPATEMHDAALHRKLLEGLVRDAHPQKSTPFRP